MQTKKRKMKAGEALVGMKRSGSQLGKINKRCVSFIFVRRGTRIVRLGWGEGLD